MKKVILICSLLFALVGSTFAGVPSANDKNAQLLFVMLSKKAAIKVIDKQAGTYQLTLKDVNPDVIYFSNRPARFSNHIALDKFTQQWQSGTFKKVPPNAMMEAVRLNDTTGKPTRTVSYAIVLKKPVYNKTNNELTFVIHALPGSPLALPESANSGYVAIFIDNFCWSCTG